MAPLKSITGGSLTAGYLTTKDMEEQEETSLRGAIGSLTQTVGSPVQEKRSPIGRVLQENRDIIVHIQEVTTQLESRLAEVLTPDTPSEQTEGVDKEIASDLVRFVGSNNDNLQGVVRKLESVLKRLQV